MLLNNTLQIITYTLWAVFGILIVGYLLTAINRRTLGIAIPGLVVRAGFSFLVATLIITYVNASAAYIEPQEVGVVLSTIAPDGYYDRPLRSGLRWIVPMLEQIKRYPISWQTYTMAASPNEGQKVGDDSIKARTSDGQEVSLDCSLIFQLDPDQVMRIHIDWQGRYIEDFVRPVARGIVRSIVSQYTADEVNSGKRTDLERDVNRQLRETFQDKGFNLDRFILRNVAFSPEYATSIEMKQVALQEITQTDHQADQARRRAQGEADAVIIKAKADADAVLIKAKMDAEAVRLVGDALKQNKDMLTYAYIDKLAPNVRVMLVPNNAPYLLPVPDVNADTVPVTPTVSTTRTPAPSITATPTITATRTATPTGR